MHKKRSDSITLTEPDLPKTFLNQREQTTNNFMEDKQSKQHAINKCPLSHAREKRREGHDKKEQPINAHPRKPNST